MQFVSFAPAAVSAPAFYANPVQYPGNQMISPQSNVVQNAPLLLHQHSVPSQQYVLTQQISRLSIQNVSAAPIYEQQTICWAQPRIVSGRNNTKICI